MKKNDFIGLDTNILIYADDSSSSFHQAARDVLEEVLRGILKACLSHQILTEYYSVITSSSRCKQPLNADEAKQRILFLNRKRVFKKIYPKRSTLKRTVEFCSRHDLRGPRIFDAVYAMTLLDNGVCRLKTNNVRDFVVFQKLGLKTEALVRS